MRIEAIAHYRSLWLQSEMTPEKWSSDEFATIRETIAEVCARLTKAGWIEKYCVTNSTFLTNEWIFQTRSVPQNRDP